MAQSFDTITILATPDQMTNVNRLKIFLINTPQKERINILARIGTFFHLESQNDNENQEINYNLWQIFSILFMETIIPDKDGIVTINHSSMAYIWFDLCVNYSTFQPLQDLINAFLST